MLGLMITVLQAAVVLLLEYSYGTVSIGPHSYRSRAPPDLSSELAALSVPFGRGGVKKMCESGARVAPLLN